MKGPFSTFIFKLFLHTVTMMYYLLSSDSIDMAVEKYLVQKVSLLRSFSKKLGVQIFLREYNFDSKTKAAFGEEDIINVFPVVKHIHPKVTTTLKRHFILA